MSSQTNYWLIPLVLCVLFCFATGVSAVVFYNKDQKSSYDMNNINVTVAMAVVCVLSTLAMVYCGKEAMAPAHLYRQ